MEILQVLIENGPSILGNLSLVLSGLIGLFLLIPGEQPEKALQAALDFIKKFSKK